MDESTREKIRSILDQLDNNDDIDIGDKGHIMTPEEARGKLASLGYTDIKIVPKQSHYLQALYRIAMSRSGRNFEQEMRRVRAFDPRHRQQLDQFKPSNQEVKYPNNNLNSPINDKKKP